MKTYHSLIIVLFVSSFFGCEKPHDSEGLSRTTFYPDFFLNGEKTQQADVPLTFIQEGDTYTPLDVKAKEGDTEIGADRFTNSPAPRYFKGKTVDTSKPDIYDVTYKAINVDGYSGTFEVPIFVYPSNGNMVNNIQGLYTSTIVRNGTSSPQYTDLEYVLIVKTGDNTYAFSDGIGGYYDFGRGYGVAYAAKNVIITANDISTNNFSFTSKFGVGAFGGVANITSMTVDAPKKQIKFTTVWKAGSTTYTFVVTLTQVTPTL